MIRGGAISLGAVYPGRPSFSLSCHQQESVDSSLNAAVLFQNPLGIQQPVPAGVHRKARKFPLDDPGKPHERTHIIEFKGR